MINKPTMLMILDGFGLNPDSYGNAIASSKKPNLDYIFENYPSIKLNASGLLVGLPQGQMGNSEVGHLNIGSGRIVYQELTRISKAIDDGIFFDNISLNQAMEHCKDKALHIFGLLSDGGVHSHIDHIKALVKMAKAKGLKKVYLHCFMDGRDVAPTSGAHYVAEMKQYLSDIGLGQIGLICGRYYAMDRDKRWDRVEASYDCLTISSGNENLDPEDVVNESYKENKTDEFILPTMCTAEAIVRDGDSIIFANFRPDRAREITRAFVSDDFDGFERKVKIKDLCFVTMTQYDKTIPNVLVAFPPSEIKNTLGQYISSLGLNQLRIAETEKYAHVTFFFNGGIEEAYPLEDRILVPSPKVATYDLKPEMSAFEVTKEVIEQIRKDKYQLIILNFANADMVGHTGVFPAAVSAIEALDSCVKNITDEILKKDGQILLTADHGNADEMLDKDGNIITAHSTNLVPLVHISNAPCTFTKDTGKLADIAPTLLKLMELSVPQEMTGDALV